MLPTCGLADKHNSRNKKALLIVSEHNKTRLCSDGILIEVFFKKKVAKMCRNLTVFFWIHVF